MTETQKRIKAYKEALPALRERVIAVALLLAMSASMLTSASFAWISISTAPEVSGMSTTVAANGNLEIALVDPEGNTPPESKEGDSSAHKDQSIAGANITWGNLVNLSDPDYGLDQIALRPALFNTINTKTFPLYGATYGQDGRVISTTDKYRFARWKKNEIDGKFFFDASDNAGYGVRAISSVEYKNITGDALVTGYANSTQSAYDLTAYEYRRIVDEGHGERRTVLNGKTCVDALEELVAVFAQDKVNEVLGSGETKTSCSPYLYNFYLIVTYFQDVMAEEGKALTTMANWQAYIHASQNGQPTTNNTFGNIDEVLAAANSKGEIAAHGVKLTTLPGYKTDLNNLRSCITGLKDMAEACKEPDSPNLPPYYWDNISTYVDKFVKISSASINGVSLGGSIGMTQALQILKGGDVIVREGILKNFEQRVLVSDDRMAAPVKITVSMGTVSGTVKTNASGNPKRSDDQTYCASLKQGEGGEATAKDTYGLAIDLWVRTNHPNALLTLEGDVITKKEQAKDADGNLLYTITINEVPVDVYEKDGTYYYSSNDTEVSEEDLNASTPVKKEVDIIIGYQGENRIWEDWETLLDQGLIEKDATTQGSGSCFVFYADTPTEQAKIIEMLNAFTIAFIDKDGNPLGTAKLNTDRAYENQGKFTVPLEVFTGVDYEDDEGNLQKGIMELTQNEAARITAIVYLNGSLLKNENVLSAGEIEGQLNIQFGSSASLVAPDDEVLQMEYRSITAKASYNGSVSTKESEPISFAEYNPNGYPISVELTVDGEAPERITGFFIRVINASQGTREEVITFTDPEGDGTWTGSGTLTNPGTYVLSTLLVDGIQYNLHDDNHPAVKIEGLKILNATTMPSSGTYMTAEPSLDVSVSAQISAVAELSPKRVQAQFFSEDNSKQVTALMSYDSVTETWTGTTSINSSGTYILKYLAIDGQVEEVPEAYQTKLVCYLNMTARVFKDEDTATDYMFEGKAIQLPMYARIINESGNPIENLSNVTLYYHRSGSAFDDDGMWSAMTWDAGTKYYTTVLNMKGAGVYDFNRITIKNQDKISSIYDGGNAPIFTAIAEDPPEYVSGNVPAATQIAITDAATMSVELTNADAVVAWAQVRNSKTGQTEYIYQSGKTTDASTGITTFTFGFATDGVRTLERVLCQNVYDKVNNKFYSASTTSHEGYPLTPTETVTTDVISTVTPVVYYDGVEKTGSFTDAYGGTKDAPTGAFMQSYTTKVMSLKVTDYAGRALPNTSAKWTIQYNIATDTTYGGYDGATMAPYDVEMTSSDGKTFTAAAQTLQFAGEYDTTINVTIAGQNMGAMAVKPKFTVSSVKPTVKITAISPTGTFDVDTSGAGSGHQSATVPAWNATTATVYFKCSRSGSGSTCDPYRHNYSRPSVTMTLTGIGNATQATVSFGSGVHIYNGTTQTDSYAWTANGTCVRNIGYYRSRTANNDEKTPAGTLTSSTLTLTHSTGTYTVTIPTITINNPY